MHFGHQIGVENPSKSMKNPIPKGIEICIVFFIDFIDFFPTLGRFGSQNKLSGGFGHAPFSLLKSIWFSILFFDAQWTKNEPKMDQKLTKNGSKMDQKWNKNEAKLAPKWTKHFRCQDKFDTFKQPQRPIQDVPKTLPHASKTTKHKSPASTRR